MGSQGIVAPLAHIASLCLWDPYSDVLDEEIIHEKMLMKAARDERDEILRSE